MNTFEVLLEAYGSLEKDFLSDYFKENVDESTPRNAFYGENMENPFREALITGYAIRCAENKIKEQELRKPDKKIQDILKSKFKTNQKIKEIAEYLDDHSNLGLQEKISNYSLISFETIKYFLEKIFEDLVLNFLKIGQIPEQFGKIRPIEDFNEMISRNLYFGYLYKLSEEIVEKNRL